MARRAGWRQWLIPAVAVASLRLASAAIDPALPSPELLLFIADTEEAVEDAPPESYADEPSGSDAGEVEWLDPVEPESSRAVPDHDER